MLAKATGGVDVAVGSVEYLLRSVQLLFGAPPERRAAL